MSKMTIEEVESRLEQGLAKLRLPAYKPLETFLQPLIPKGYRAHVALVDAKKGGKQRKKRKDASADSWSPDFGEVRIYFEPDVAAAEKMQEVAAEPCATKDDVAAPDPISDLVRTLDRVESETRLSICRAEAVPRRRFVG